MLQFLNINGFWTLKFSHTKMGGNEKKQQSPPVGWHSYITHFKIKSETEFWQACYFLQCQEPHNRPFFGQSSKNAWRFRVTESRNFTNIAHPFLLVPLLALLETILYFLCVWQKERNILISVATSLKEGWQRKASSDSGCLSSGLVASGQGL